nr:unnamed protein product [Digitaria exilis]
MGKACFCGPVAIELCSMGGIAECGVSVDTKASPRRAAIEKAQEELRQEYDVREQRRRELEFLEKGGNPLDFKLGHVAPLSVQSTSVTDQITEQNVISEAKGSFAFAASPHGDSVESSGKPGNSLCPEANTADNLMLLDGDTSNVGGDKTAKRGIKRANATQAEQFLHCDGQNNAKEGEDSGLSRLGPKSQAYARRRSKSVRENANSALVRYPPVLPLNSQQKDVTGLIPEAKTEDNGVSSIGDSKPTSPKCQNMLKNESLNDKVVMETDSVQAIHEGSQTSNNELSNINNGSQGMEISPNSVTDNSHLTVGDQVATETASAVSPDALSKEAASRMVCSLPSISNEILKEAQTPEKAGNSPSIVIAVDVHADSMDNKSVASHPAVECTSLNENELDPARAYATNKAANEHPGQNEDLVPVKASEMVDEGLNSILPEDKHDKKDGQLEISSQPVVLDDSPSRQPELSCPVSVKDETEICNNAVDAQNNTEQHATSNQDKENKEECSDSHKNNGVESSVAQKLGSATVPPASLTSDVTNPVENDVEKCSGDQEKIAKKECEDSIVAKKDHEDAILRRARYIEANIKRAGERSLCNISLEKKRKSHWDFVLEEMVWMANDFMQERLWKSAAAALMSHCISSRGRAVFEEANIQRKQKSVARVLANVVTNFWRSVDTSRASGGMSKPMQIEQSNEIEKKKLAGAKAGKLESEENLEQDKSRQSHQSPIRCYALRLLEYNRNESECRLLAEAPQTPDRLNDFGILKVPGQLSEVKLFYCVAPGAMHAYRESMERLFVYNKKIGNSVLKNDYEPSTYASTADVPMENAYGDDEGEAHTYLLPGAYDGGLASKLNHKKKHPVPQRMNGTRPYEIGSDMPYEPFLDSKPGNHQFMSNGKRTTDFLSIPIKRIGTAARQRIGPYDPRSQVDLIAQYDQMAAGHSGPGSPWSSFEDQALVVLVHDMGENWELVSDALNSIIQLKGSARQLFQRLQGPFEEETLKTHFEKIIFVGQKLHQTRRKGEIQELRQINPLHTSHIFALSQACPGNLSGVLLTPLDLCDGPSNTDTLSIGYPGSHTSGIALPNNHGSIGSTLPTSNANSRLPGSPGMVLGSNSPLPLNAPSRDAQRFVVPRPTSLQGDEQSRIHYGQMVNGRNLQQPGVPVPGVLPSGVDRSARMMPPAHGVGIMTGINRGTPVPRPGFPRVGSPGMAVVSHGNMSPNNGQGLQNTVNVHPGVIPGPGNTMLRPRDSMQMLRVSNQFHMH